MKRKAVFLDRDGTIIHDANYLDKKENIKLFDGAAEAIKKLNEAGFIVIIITNQSGVARGYFAEEIVIKLNKELVRMLEKEGAKIDGVYYCPHHTKGSIEKYSIECECRKPKIGMLKKAAEDFDIDLPNSYMVGDKPDDINLAKNAGCKSILVKTGYGVDSMDKCSPDFIAEDIVEAVEIILKKVCN